MSIINIRKSGLITIDLDIPEPANLAQILYLALKTQFAEVTVNWSMVDLTQKPFNLLAPGLCGNSALIDVGGTSNIFPEWQTFKTYNITDVLNEIGYNQNYTFLIGGSMCPWINNTFGELFTNTLFSPALDGTIQIIRDNSLFTLLNDNTRTCVTQYITALNHKCSMQGNFFVSNGEEGPLLKVQAKKRIGNFGFVSTIQNSLTQSYNNFVGLGGTFMVDGTYVRHHVTPNVRNFSLLKTRENIHKWLYYYDVQAPVIAVGTIVNKNRLLLRPTQLIPAREISLTQRHFNAYSAYSMQGGFFHTDVATPDTVTYLGYFYPAKKLYRLDPTPFWPPLPEFTDIISCW